MTSAVPSATSTVAAASRVATAGSVWMALGAGVATKVLIVLFDRIVDCNDANAVIAGAFLLGYGWLCSVLSVRVGKDMLDHDVEDAVNAVICHRVENVFPLAVGLQNAR